MSRLDTIVRTTLLSVCVAAGACGDAVTASGAQRRFVGVLQLEPPRVGTVAATEAAPTGGDTPIRWDVPPGERGTVTAPRPIESPDTVRAGEPFEVTVHTIGENGCWRADGQDVRTSENTVTVVPWDAHSGADVCTQVLGYLPHRVTVTLATRGVGTIRIEGRRVRQGDRTWEMPVRAERSVVVR